MGGLIGAGYRGCMTEPSSGDETQGGFDQKAESSVERDEGTSASAGVESRQARSALDRYGPMVGFTALGVLAVVAVILGAVVWATSDVQTTELERDGMAALDAEEWSEAEEVFTTLLGQYPPDATDEMALALHRRSIAYFSMGRVEEALADETAAIELNPSDVWLLATLHLNRSREYSYLGRTQDSIAAATAAIELEPNDPKVLARAYSNRGTSLASLNRMDDALADFDAAIAVSSNPSERAHYRLHRAEALFQLQRFAEAAEEASHAIEALSLSDSEQRDGTDARTSTLLGRAHLVRGSAVLLLEGPSDNISDTADQIETDLTLAVDLIADDDSRLAQAYFARGFLYYVLLDDLAAQSDLEQVLDLVPSSDPMYHNATELLAEILI